MTLRDQIVSEIMSLVRPPPRTLERRPTIDELERILNSESTDAVHIEPDGSVSVTPTVTTVGAVADKVALLVSGAVQNQADLTNLWRSRAEIAEAKLAGLVWKPIAECPYLGEQFLAAVQVHNFETKAFSHFEYAALYMDEGRLHFHDGAETGWDVSDYTPCLPFTPPPKPDQKDSKA